MTKNPPANTTGATFGSFPPPGSPWTQIEQLRAELVACQAKSAERKAALERLLSVVAAADFYPGMTIPTDIYQQVKHALQDKP